MKRVCFTIATLLLLAPALKAANLKIENPTVTGAPLSEYVFEAALNKMRAKIDAEFPTQRQINFLRAVANAGVLSNKGLGVDYATTPDVFVIGAGAGLGVQGLSVSDLNEDFGCEVQPDETCGADEGLSNFRNFEKNGYPQIGVIPAVSFMVGVSMSDLASTMKNGKQKRTWLSDYTFYANFVTYNITDDETYDGRFTAVGAHVQYRLLQPFEAGWKAFRWGGLAATTGLEYYKLHILWETDIDPYDVEQDLVSGETKMLVRWFPDGKLGVDIEQLSVPLELSTNVRLGYILTFFAGAGLDINFGRTASISNQVGHVRGDISDADTGAIISTIEGTGVLELGEKEGPAFTHFRGFGGVQVSLSVIHVYAQANYVPAEQAYGVNAGARIAW